MINLNLLPNIPKTLGKGQKHYKEQYKKCPICGEQINEFEQCGCMD